MPTPGEHKTVQARILAYAKEIGWTFVPRGEAEKRRGFDYSRSTPAEQATVLEETGVKNAEGVSAKIAKAFVDHPNWRQSESDLRELRKAMTFAIYAEVEDLDRVTNIVDRVFSRLEKSQGEK
jgi:type I restriction enzyme R subunit